MYQYNGETNAKYIKGKRYGVRKSKNGEQTFIESEKGETLLFVAKLSRINDSGETLLANFDYIDAIYYKNYKDYQKNKNES